MTVAVAVVTGANSGIGRQAAVDLAARGWTVFGTMRSLDKGAKLAALADEAGVIYEACTSDQPSLRYTCGWGGPELINVRCTIDDADWVELGAVTDDAAYAERFQELLGLDIG
jgi:NAD(P)-dependent dehydrogenase (short-subunit alcohol dehydrogenase family)